MKLIFNMLGVGVRRLTTGLTTLHQETLEPLVVKVKVRFEMNLG